MEKYLGKILILLAIALTACSDNQQLLKKMSEIKRIGDDKPELALAMLDSIKNQAIEGDDHTHMTYEMLLLRLNDKANRIPTSDILSNEVVTYFAKHGNDKERQEAYYYNGSVYRDLQDTPRALENFLESIEIGEKSKHCDSLLLRNAYSNMHFLFYNTQDYKNEMIYAQKEYYLSKKLNQIGFLQYLHLGLSYSHLKKPEQAKSVFNDAYKYIIHQPMPNKDYVYTLLYYLSELKEREKAFRCYQLIKDTPHNDIDPADWTSLAEYYKLVNQPDSETLCLKQAIKEDSPLENIYDASKSLFTIYEKQGNTSEALKYAKIYVEASDSLDLGKRQELAATVNNQYQYHINRSKDQMIEHKAKRYRSIAVALLITLIFVTLLGFTIHIMKRNRHLKQLVSMSDQLKGAKTKIEDVNKELKEVQSELNEKKELLSEKMEQSQTLLRIINKTRLEEEADKVVEAIRNSANGKKNMSDDHWNQLYAAVDKLYPNFKDELLNRIGKFTEQQMQFCYLMRINLTNPQIQHLTDLPRATVWRWSKKFEWVKKI